MLLAAPAAGAALLDDRGVQVSLDAPPRRIVALSPHLVEIAYAAGAGPMLAAAVRYSDYPEAARQLPRVGDASRIDLERMRALAPDLVLGWKSGNPAHDLARVERMGFPLFVSETRRLADIARRVRSVGRLAGTEAAARESASAFERELDGLRARYAGRRVVRVFYEIWHRPLITVNGAHLISDEIALCGGKNVFESASALTPSVTLEAVAAVRPEAVLGGSSAAAPGDLERAWREAPLAALRALPVRYVSPDLIQRQTPRIVEGARIVCEALDVVRRSGGPRGP